MTFKPGEGEERCGGRLRYGDCVLVKSGGEHQCFGCCWYTSYREQEKEKFDETEEEVDDLP